MSFLFNPCQPCCGPSEKVTDCNFPTNLCLTIVESTVPSGWVPFTPGISIQGQYDGSGTFLFMSNNVSYNQYQKCGEDQYLFFLDCNSLYPRVLIGEDTDSFGIRTAASIPYFSQEPFLISGVSTEFSFKIEKSTSCSKYKCCYPSGYGADKISLYDINMNFLEDLNYSASGDSFIGSDTEVFCTGVYISSIWNNYRRHHLKTNTGGYAWRYKDNNNTLKDPFDSSHIVTLPSIYYEYPAKTICKDAFGCTAISAGSGYWAVNPDVYFNTSVCQPMLLPNINSAGTTRFITRKDIPSDKVQLSYNELVKKTLNVTLTRVSGFMFPICDFSSVPNRYQEISCWDTISFPINFVGTFTRKTGYYRDCNGNIMNGESDYKPPTESIYWGYIGSGYIPDTTHLIYNSPMCSTPNRIAGCPEGWIKFFMAFTANETNLPNRTCTKAIWALNCYNLSNMGDWSFNPCFTGFTECLSSCSGCSSTTRINAEKSCKNFNPLLDAQPISLEPFYMIDFYKTSKGYSSPCAGSASPGQNFTTGCTSANGTNDSILGNCIMPDTLIQVEVSE